MTNKLLRPLPILFVFLFTSNAIDANDEIYYLKNRPNGTNTQDSRTSNLTSISSGTPGKFNYGQVFGTHPYFSKLSLKVYEQVNGKLVEITTPIKEGLLPGMVLDLPLYESDAKSKQRRSTRIAISEPTNSDYYVWSDWDLGDRDVLPENSDLTWYVLSLKEELRMGNFATCKLLGETITFEVNKSNSERWTELEKIASNKGSAFLDFTNGITVTPPLLQNNSNTPWNECFTAEPIEFAKLNEFQINGLLLTEKAIEVPNLMSYQRIGFSITPNSQLGYPQKGYQAFVWDISKVWAQERPIKTDPASYNTEEKDEIKVERINKLFPERQALEGINDDMSLPISAHPIILSPKILPFYGQYRVRIFDKEYYEANKNNLDSRYNLASDANSNRSFRSLREFEYSPSETDWIYRGFYTDRSYVAIIEILDNETTLVRRLTKDEVEYIPTREDFPENEYPELPINLYWAMQWEDTNEIFDATKNSIEADKPYTIIYSYQEERLKNDDETKKIKVVYVMDENNIPTNEVEYIEFKTQLSNESNINSIEEGGDNPESGEQSFHATVNFMIDAKVDTSTLMTYEVNDFEGFKTIGDLKDGLEN